MHKRHEMIPSQRMERHVHLWCYGHYGMPILVFPSAAGFAHEWDAQGMTTALADLIEGGKIKLYCTETNVSEAWTQPGWPEHRIRRHIAFEEFIVSELVPWIAADCRHARIPIATSGCSLGGFYAANFALKFPELFPFGLCMSGRYSMTHFTEGFSNADVYFNNPMAFVAGLEGEHLERVRKTFLTLVVGRGRWEEGCIEETIALGQILDRKGIPNETDIWGHDSDHEWPWWHKQARYHFGKRFG